MRKSSSLAALPTIGALVLTLVACGGGGSSPFAQDDLDVATDELSGAPSEDALDLPEKDASQGQAEIEPAAVDLDATIRYAGFLFHLGSAELGPSEDIDGSPLPGVGRLTVDVQIENLGDTSRNPSHQDLFLEMDGEALDVGDFWDSQLPVVPEGATSNGEIVVDELPASFTLDGIELVFGSGAVHQARVPLDGEGEVIGLEPLEISTADAGQAGELTVEITSGQLQYDTAFDQLDKDQARLVLMFDVTGSSALNNHASIYSGDIQLGMPDGTRTASADFEPGAHGALGARVEPSATLRDLEVSFNIPADTRGALELVLTGGFGTEPFEDVGGFTPFELPE